MAGLVAASWGQIVTKVLKNKEAMEEYVEEVADALEDAMDDDPKARNMFLSAAMSDSSFRDRVADALVQEMIDDE